jgi:hypothetical protein
VPRSDVSVVDRSVDEVPASNPESDRHTQGHMLLAKQEQCAAPSDAEERRDPPGPDLARVPTVRESDGLD